jgi:hypothetical protein
MTRSLTHKQTHPHSAASVVQTSYTFADKVSTSRHKPVVASFALPAIDRPDEHFIPVESLGSTLGISFCVDTVK